MSGRRGDSFNLAIPALGRDTFSKKVSIQRLLNRGEAAFMDSIIRGLPDEVAFTRLQRAIHLSKSAFEQVFGLAIDEDLFMDFISTAYEISVLHPDDNEKAVLVMRDYLQIASDSAEAIWPDGAQKKSFPFRQQYSATPTLASISLKLTRCADIYDLRIGRSLFVKAITTMVVEASVDLARRMMPGANKTEIASLTQSLIKRVGNLAIEAWRETSADLIAKLREEPESNRLNIALQYNPLAKIKRRIVASLADVPEFVILMNAMIEDEVSRALETAIDVKLDRIEATATSISPG